MGSQFASQPSPPARGYPSGLDVRLTFDCLLDTNVLIYLVNTGALEHAAATTNVAGILASGTKAVIAAQSVYEFWSVATRPVAANGLGWTVELARSTVETLRARFPILQEPPEVVGIWIELVAAHDVKGKRIHDAHLLATMKANGVSQLLTFNASKFHAKSPSRKGANNL